LQPEWPADKVERRAVAALIPYARNARTHSPEQVDQIAASIREWGWTVPVLVDEQGGIIAGVLAAHKLAIAEVPVMVAAGHSRSSTFLYFRFRSLRRLWHHDHSRGNDRSLLPRDRAEPGLCRCCRDALAEFHRADRDSRGDGRGF
jgi:ParB-like nuclease domain